MTTQIIEEKRVIFEHIKLTRQQRREWKRRHVAEAKADKAPETYAKEIVIGPDHPKWKDGFALVVNVGSVFKMKVPPK